MNDAEAIIAAVEGAPAQPYTRSVEHALLDHDLPAFVRAYLAMRGAPATESCTIAEAGLMPALYADYEDRPVRVTMVSSLGDVGISHKDESHGYFKRVSIYELTNYRDEMNTTPPAKRAGRFRQFAIVDRNGFWVRVDAGAGRLAEIFPADCPVLYADAAKAGRELRKVDPLGFEGLKVVPLLFERGKT